MEKKSVAVAASLGLAGLVAGGVLMSSLSANAEGSGSGTSAPRASYGEQPGTPPNGTPPSGNGEAPSGDQSQPQRSDEKLLTGTIAEKVKAAVKAKYPTATFQRVETDSDGVYEAHILVDGKPITVELNKSFVITGTEQAPSGGRGKGQGAPPQGEQPAA